MLNDLMKCTLLENTGAESTDIDSVETHYSNDRCDLIPNSPHGLIISTLNNWKTQTLKHNTLRQITKISKHGLTLLN